MMSKKGLIALIVVFYNTFVLSLQFCSSYQFLCQKECHMQHINRREIKGEGTLL